LLLQLIPRSRISRQIPLYKASSFASLVM
jgi:hypothetical protein